MGPGSRDGEAGPGPKSGDGEAGPIKKKNIFFFLFFDFSFFLLR